MLRRLIGDDIQFVTRLADDLASVKIDNSQFAQVIMNLVVNARDAMPGGGCLTIETFNLELDAEIAAANPNLQVGRYAIVAVRDTGCGMDENLLRQIFEPFFTTKDNGKGTGLGLATVHGIVQQSGGYITVTSSIGVGTVFRIYLPVDDDSPPSPNKHDLAASAKHDIGPDSLLGTETILLAEDKADVCEYARRSLEQYGYKVLTARNGAEAIDIEMRFPDPIHLLFTDIAMPIVDGIELARQILNRRSKIKVLYASGFSDNSAIEPGDAVRVTPFLQKPYSPKQLASKIRVCLAPSGHSMRKYP